jgi:hypothetical protein
MIVEIEPSQKECSAIFSGAESCLLVSEQFWQALPEVFLDYHYKVKVKFVDFRFKERTKSSLMMVLSWAIQSGRHRLGTDVVARP